MKNYHIIRTLGEGSFAKVKSVHNVSKQQVAIKIIKHSSLSDSVKLNKVKQEAKILMAFTHPHIMRVYELIDSQDGLFIVMEYIPGGELYDLIMKTHRFSEEESRRLFQQLIFAVEYCHKHYVVHRDLKPENILLDENKNIKLGDFGLANYFRDGMFLKTSCGSLNYAAPEILTGSSYSGPEVDVWSAGVVLFILVAGYLPFDENNVTTLFNKIKAAEFVVPMTADPYCVDLLRRMLDPDPINRITIQQIKKHPWFAVNISNHLTYEVQCLNSKISSITESKPKQNFEFDEAIFNECVTHFNLQEHQINKFKLKKRLIKNKHDAFCVCYQMLRDESHKKKMIELNKASLDICPVFTTHAGRNSVDLKLGLELRKSSSFFDDVLTGPGLLIPHNWVYGFRTASDVVECLRKLFEACTFLNVVSIT